MPDGRVILYADKVTPSMQAAMSETERRRSRQIAYNEEHGIVPRTVIKALENPLDNLYGKDEDGATKKGRGGKSADKKGKGGKTGKGRKAQAAAEETPHSPADIAKLIEELEKAMRAAARELEFERAAELRDRARALRERLYVSGEEEEGQN